ncbi:MarC family protein [Pseudoxanthobacter sp.]|uniref:MarC family protein n=1 Tax=Pseudoxanthobacter sp. TaxID=1925742 RepID=UPI002FE40BA7
MDLTVTIKLFAALFAIMNPFVCLSVFLALTDEQTAADRRRTAVLAIITVSVGSVVCALAGSQILSVFGIGIDNFRLAGGLIVLLIALSMLKGDEHASHAGNEQEQANYRSDTSVAFYPLAVPMMLGPGTITALIVFMQSSMKDGTLLAYALGLGSYLVFFSAFLLAAPVLARWLSPTVLSVTKRLMGIVLAAIGGEMMTTAISNLYPALLR